MGTYTNLDKAYFSLHQATKEYPVAYRMDAFGIEFTECGDPDEEGYVMVDLHIPYDEFARIAFHALAMMEAISQHAVEANDKGDGALFDLMDDLADEPGAMKILPDWKSIDGGNEPDGD